MIAFEQGNLRLRVEYDFSSATPDVHHLPNGDPGYPGDPEELEITSVVIEQQVNGKWGSTGIELLGWLLDDETEPPLEQLYALVIAAIDKEVADVADERAWQAFQENP